MLSSFRFADKLFTLAARPAYLVVAGGTVIFALFLCVPLSAATRARGSANFHHPRAFPAESTLHVVSGKWYDGSWWEMDIPKPWNVTETSNKHIRLANAGAKVLVGFRHHHRVHPMSKRDEWARANLPPAQEAAYSATKSESEGAWWSFPFQSPFSTGKVERTDISELIGWTFVAWSGYRTKKWAGFLTRDPWSLYVRLESPGADFEAHKATVTKILMSIRFHP